jgi:hypothetical protein
MTNEQLEQLAQLVANKIFERMTELPAWEPMTPTEFFHHQVDGFGNIKHVSRKDLLYTQMQQLDEQRSKLLEEEKYELLIELEEIYDKLKKEHDKL